MTHYNAASLLCNIWLKQLCFPLPLWTLIVDDKIVIVIGSSTIHFWVFLTWGAFFSMHFHFISLLHKSLKYYPDHLKLFIELTLAFHCYGQLKREYFVCNHLGSVQICQLVGSIHPLGTTPETRKAAVWMKKLSNRDKGWFAYSCWEKLLM